MNCCDCANTGTYRDAIAICVDCGAGGCTEHAVNTRLWLTHQMAVSRLQRIHPPAGSFAAAPATPCTWPAATFNRSRTRAPAEPARREVQHELRQPGDRGGPYVLQHVAACLIKTLFPSQEVLHPSQEARGPAHE